MSGMVMGEVANQRNVVQAVSAGAPFLAADVGGTHARIALVARQAHPRQPIGVLHYERYACGEWPSLAAILADFAGRHEARANQCVVAIAGYVAGDAIANTNLPWQVSLAEIRNGLGLERLSVVNDFEAVAYASQYVDQADTVPVILGSREPAPGPVIVMGPGTGLGSAVLLPGQPHAQVLHTEGGQIALAPGNELEIEILRIFARTRSYVSAEQILSGPGLLQTYRAISSLRSSAAVVTSLGEASGALAPRSSAIAR